MTFTWRPGQQEAIAAAGNHFANGVRVVEVAAATGFGKSIANLEIAKGTPTYYLTPLNALLDQLATDPLTRNRVAVVMGAGNYPCSEAANCAAGGRLGCRRRRDNTCPYMAAKKRAEHAEVYATNIAYFLSVPAKSPELILRDMMILDEAQDVETMMQERVGLTISDRDGNFTIPATDDPDVIGPWVENEVRPGLLEAIQEGDQRLRALRDDWLTSNEQRRRQLSVVIRKTSAQLANFQRMVDNIDEISADSDVNPWFAELRTWASGQHSSIRIVPLTAARYVRRYLLDRARRAIISTATPPTPADLGLGEGEVRRIDVPHPFPVRNRPIYFTPVASMSFRNREGGAKLVAEEIDRLVERYGGVKTLVHCHAYSIAELIQRHLRSPHVFQDSRNREDSLEAWKAGNLPVFLSVSMHEGIDLPDDLCRLNVIARVPYPDKSAQAVRRRLRSPGGQEWYDRRAADAIVQACGRAVRHADDWAHTFILDKDFAMLRRKSHLFPGWFLEALR